MKLREAIETEIRIAQKMQKDIITHYFTVNDYSKFDFIMQ